MVVLAFPVSSHLSMSTLHQSVVSVYLRELLHVPCTIC